MRILKRMVPPLLWALAATAACICAGFLQDALPPGGNRASVGNQIPLSTGTLAGLLAGALVAARVRTLAAWMLAPSIGCLIGIFEVSAVQWLVSVGWCWPCDLEAGPIWALAAGVAVAACQDRLRAAVLAALATPLVPHLVGLASELVPAPREMVLGHCIAHYLESSLWWGLSYVPAAITGVCLAGRSRKTGTEMGSHRRNPRWVWIVLLSASMMGIFAANWMQESHLTSLPRVAWGGRSEEDYTKRLADSLTITLGAIDARFREEGYRPAPSEWQVHSPDRTRFFAVDGEHRIGYGWGYTDVQACSKVAGVDTSMPLFEAMDGIPANSRMLWIPRDLVDSTYCWDDPLPDDGAVVTAVSIGVVRHRYFRDAARADRLAVDFLTGLKSRSIPAPAHSQR